MRCTDAAALSEALKVNTTLVEVGLEGEHKWLSFQKQKARLFSLSHPSGNFIGDMGAAALSEALKSNATLTRLDLESEGQPTSLTAESCDFS